jgi:hypothetical protein
MAGRKSQTGRLISSLSCEGGSTSARRIIEQQDGQPPIKTEFRWRNRDSLTSGKEIENFGITMKLRGLR